MTDHSRRRRLAARGTMAAALLALPLTASICYSEAVAAPPVAPHPPEAPAAPGAPAAPAPGAPLPPPAPEAPELEDDVALEREFDAAERDLERAERELERAQREMERTIEREMGSASGKRRVQWNGKDWDEMSPAERKAFEKEMKKLRLKFAEGGEYRVEMDKALEQMRADGEMQRELRKAMAEAHSASRVAVASAHASAVAARASAPRVVEKCIDDDAPVTSRTDDRGRTVLYVCEEFGDRIALKAMQSARHAIARDRNLSEEARAEALRELDEEIAEHSR